MATSWRYWAAYAAFAAVVLGVGRLFNQMVPPYMDETLHIPQAQAYCRGDWRSWDPLITTPPGLYLISALAATALPSASAVICSTSNLRLVNSLFLILLPYIYSRLFSLIRHPVVRSSTRGKTTPSKAVQEAVEFGEAQIEGLALGLFPVLAFFGWLYYTDLGSVVLVLVSYDFCLRRRWVASALMGAISLLFRQTNIAWVAFIAGIAVVRQLEARSEVFNPPLSRVSLLEPLASFVSLVIHSLQHPLALAMPLLPYLFVVLAAGAFVRWNGGIVLGDKSNHVPTVHIPQIYYFTAFSALFLAPITLSSGTILSAVSALFGSFRRALVSSSLLVAMLWTIKSFTMAHPFLLADNRHYAFYVWRRVINVHPLARYALAPGYLVAGRILFDHLSASATLPLLPLTFFLVAVLLILVPTPLIEPRYFLTPFLLLRLHLRPIGGRRERQRRLLLEATVYIAVLATTVAIFLGRGFKWEGREDTMRFMW